jgi:hypothetical protein
MDFGGQQMSSQVEVAIVSAYVAGAVASVGWFITNHLTQHREEEARRTASRAQASRATDRRAVWTLLGLIQQSNAFFDIAVLRRDLNDSDSERAWNYFIEEYFLPLNAQIGDPPRH